MTSQSFSREARLTKKLHYDSVFAETSFKFSSASVLVLVRFQTDPKKGRLGIVAAKKHLKSSIGRNRFKRLVRESFRLNPEKLNGCDIVVLSRPGSRKSETIHTDLSNAWAKLSRKRASRQETVQSSSQVAGNEN